MADTIQLKLGEEQSIHLPPLAGGDWQHTVEGMSSAIQVRKLWPADPYPEDDEDEGPRETPDVVFMVRGVAPGSASIRFSAGGKGGGTRELRITVLGSEPRPERG